MATRRKKPATEPAGAAPPAAELGRSPAGAPAAEGPNRADPPAALDPEPAAQELGHPGSAAPEGLDLNSPKTYDQALRELGIDVPVAACRLVGNRLEFRLYGGRVLYWPPAAGDQPPAAKRKKKGK
ncbi:MAG: hypothetical protein GX597_00235 [Anaerolineaceae bacterium]|nr:hypothetical protein [Anaerolineaceae bacterium]